MGGGRIGEAIFQGHIRVRIRYRIIDLFRGSSSCWFTFVVRMRVCVSTGVFVVVSFVVRHKETGAREQTILTGILQGLSRVGSE